MTGPSTRIPVAVLGATGSVGQRFVQLLDGHPWFEIAALCASERSAGRRYADAARWVVPGDVPAAVADRELASVTAPVDAPLVFSALDASVAGEVESHHAREGRLVVSNAKNHRMDADVPLVVPEVNADHLALLERQSFPDGGGIIANPNCSTAGLVLALAPLERAFGVQRAHVVTMQALSGAGVPGVSSLDALDNLIPHISGEEDKLETETQKILGVLEGGAIRAGTMTVSAQCNRVPVIDGHMECVSLELGRDATFEALVECWRGFKSEPQELALPSAPERPTIYLDAPDAPQPRRHRDLERGMATSIGRLQPCGALGWKLVLLSHNTLRGAAGGALLTAELCVARGIVASG